MKRPRGLSLPFVTGGGDTSRAARANVLTFWLGHDLAATPRASGRRFVLILGAEGLDRGLVRFALGTGKFVSVVDCANSVHYHDPDFWPFLDRVGDPYTGHFLRTFRLFGVLLVIVLLDETFCARHIRGDPLVARFGFDDLFVFGHLLGIVCLYSFA